MEKAKRYQHAQVYKLSEPDEPSQVSRSLPTIVSTDENQFSQNLCTFDTQPIVAESGRDTPEEIKSKTRIFVEVII